MRETDNIVKRKKYKEERFGNKKTTVDDYTGKRIKKSNTDTDHIVPIDSINRKYSNLSLEQRKKLANCDANYATTSSSINRSKGSASNAEYLNKMLRSGKKVTIEQAGRMLDAQMKAEKAIDKQARKMKRENAINSAHSLLKKIHK